MFITKIWDLVSWIGIKQHYNSTALGNHIELDRRIEISRSKWYFYHKAKILWQSWKPEGQNNDKAEKFIEIALLLTNYYMTEYYFYLLLCTNYILTALYNQPFIS